MEKHQSRCGPFCNTIFLRGFICNCIDQRHSMLRLLFVSLLLLLAAFFSLAVIAGFFLLSLLLFFSLAMLLAPDDV